LGRWHAAQRGTINPTTRTLLATHVYVDDQPTNTPLDQYRVQVFITDNHGATDSTPLGLFLEEIHNILPDNLSVQVAGTAIDENGLVGLSGSFTDPGVLDTHEVTIDWGDGSVPTALVLPPGVTSIPLTQHRYLDDPADGETYSFTVQVADDD
jgi:hypothetical protein